MKKHLIVLKLGGSFITDKSKPFTAKPENIQLFAKELAAAYKQYPDADFLGGNGVGSFAHFTAHQYGLRNGAHSDKDFYGMCLTHNGARRLNTMVSDALTQHQLPAFGMSPAAMMLCSDDVLEVVTMKPLQQLLKNHCMPVLHGDTILDNKRGTTGVSTEEVLFACMQQLRKNYQKITVIYAMDVSGVLDANGETIPELASDQDITLHANNAYDVTGSITGKIKSARKSALIADEVHLINGTIPGSLAKVLGGEPVGTRVIR